MTRYALPWLLVVCAGGACAGAPEGATQPSSGPSATAEPASIEPAPSASTAQPKVDTPLTYGTQLHEGGGVAFDIAEEWKVSGEESGTLLASSPDGQAVLMFHIAEPEDLHKTLAAIRRTLAAEVKDIYLGPNKERKLGELTVEYASGAGKLEGRPVELGQLLVATPTGKVLVVVAVIEATAPSRAKKAARHTLESIRPPKTP